MTPRANSGDAFFLLQFVERADSGTSQFDSASTRFVTLPIANPDKSLRPSVDMTMTSHLCFFVT